MALRAENRIKILRKSAGLSQTDFARLFSVDQTAVSNWENGKNSIDMQTADKIADHFGVPVEYVYGKPYKVTRAVSVWSESEKRAWELARNAETRSYLEFVNGRGVFEKSGTTLAAEDSSPAPTEDDIKVALFGGAEEVTDEMWNEVKKFVEFIKSKKER